MLKSEPETVQRNLPTSKRPAPGVPGGQGWRHPTAPAAGRMNGCTCYFPAFSMQNMTACGCITPSHACRHSLLTPPEEASADLAPEGAGKPGARARLLPL